jgi:hypothetical protein
MAKELNIINPVVRLKRLSNKRIRLKRLSNKRISNNKEPPMIVSRPRREKEKELPINIQVWEKFFEDHRGSIPNIIPKPIFDKMKDHETK